MPRKPAYPQTRANPTVTAVCVECSSEFERSTFATGKIRCDLCQGERNAQKRAESVARRKGQPRQPVASSRGDKWNCWPGKCPYFKACRRALQADRGAPLMCTPEPIPVVGFDVSSEFDGLRLGAWREEAR